MAGEFNLEREALEAILANSRALRMEQCAPWTAGIMPASLKTPAACLAAVKRQGMLLEFVPEALRTEAVCRAAVESDGRALEFVPEKLKTAEICRMAISRNGLAMAFVPKSLHAAVKPQRDEGGSAFS